MIPLRYNVRSLMVRRTTSVMTALAVAFVVMILTLLLGFVGGLKRTMLLSGTPGNWIVLSQGVTSESNSHVTQEQYEILRSRPELAVDSAGAALISPEEVTDFILDADHAADRATPYVRGVAPIAYRVHRHMRLLSGRWPMQGTAEMIVGRKLAVQHPDLAPSREVRFGSRNWAIVGVFADDDSVRESEIWTDLATLRQEVGETGGFNVIFVTLKPGTSGSFERALAGSARLSIDAKPETQFYSDGAQLADQLRGLSLVFASILAAGAVFGGMNAMYSAIARRTREIGVMRALGFGHRGLLTSFMTENLILALAGGVAGELLTVAVAYLTGLQSRLMNVGQFIFSFAFSPAVFAGGLAFALLIGIIGGLPPACRAVRIRVLEALHEG
ncbi:MAG: ABC transporter permease [Candidatus Binataceae bacterium]